MNTIVHLCSHEWKGSWKKGEEDHLAEVKKSTRNLRTRERVRGILILNTKFCAFERQKKSGRDIDYYYQILHWQSKIETYAFITFCLLSLFQVHLKHVKKLFGINVLRYQLIIYSAIKNIVFKTGCICRSSQIYVIAINEMSINTFHSMDVMAQQIGPSLVRNMLSFLCL